MPAWCRYELKEEIIGTGAFSICKKCVNVQTGEAFACKIVSKAKCDPRLEIELLSKCAGHANVITMLDSYTDAHHTYIVMPIMAGGELLDRIKSKKRFTEHEASVIFKKLVEAVKFLHDKQIVHRDLKPENLLFESEDDDAELKIVDFGFARRLAPQSAMFTPCFTQGYAAPEQLMNYAALQSSSTAAGQGLLPKPEDKAVGYDASCDLWSLGVILYTMLCGYPPFFSRRKNVSSSEILEKMKEGSLTYPAEQWQAVSTEAKTLVAGLLKFNPVERLKVQNVLGSAWIKEHAPIVGRLTRRDSDLLSPGILRGPQIFNAKRKRSRSHLNEVFDQYQAMNRMANDVDPTADSSDTLKPLEENALVKRRREKKSLSGSSLGSRSSLTSPDIQEPSTGGGEGAST